MTAGATVPAGTVGEALRAVADCLAGAGCVSPQAEARWLVEEALGLDGLGGLALRRGEPLGEAARERLAGMVARRAAGEPLQYVVGWAPFGPLRLEVGPGVFVPRPETEVLAGRAAELLAAAPPPRVAVDLCTGSGAIACLLASRARPPARVVATELDPRALRYARANCARHGVELYQGDLDEPLPAELAGQVRVLTANAPYVPSAKLAFLPRDVREHEPRLALDGGPDGLRVLRRVVRLAGRWLAPGGWLVCEIGEDQGRAVVALFCEAGFEAVRVRPDLAGRDRVVEGRRRGGEL